MNTVFRKTKIICTLGPATDDENVLRKIMLAGMDAARFNFSHGTHEEHARRIEAFKRLRAELDLPIPMILDTKGPEIRLGRFQNGKAELATGQTFTLVTEECLGDEKHAFITDPDLPDEISIGTRIMIDDGLLELKAEHIQKGEIVCTVVHGGTVSNNKSMNVPGIHLSIPFISEKDKADIAFGVEHEFDYIAASFTRSAEDLLSLRVELDKHHDHNTKLIAKIENAEGVANIDSIIQVANGIMVARGDMGVEIPFEELPAIQKDIIKKVYNAGKIVITATQMLDSMIKNPRPTRAEATDVANAIYDGTSVIMLSGETAAGNYPVESVETMVKIALKTEASINYKKRFESYQSTDSASVTNAISHATCTTAMDLGAAAIITLTKSGKTARMISKYRPDTPIMGCTTDERTWRQLNLSWGVIPFRVVENKDTDELFEQSVSVVEKAGLVCNGDVVVITAGVPLGILGTTNLLKVHIVGDVLVSGVGAVSASICGNLCVCRDEEEARRNFQSGDILVIPQTSNGILDLLRKASGIITEADGINSHAAVVGMTLDIPVIVGAANATLILKSGTTVTMDGNRGYVYSK